MLAALLGLSAPALARHAEGSDNAATLEALVADPQLVISRESLIASMTEPDTQSSDAMSGSANDTPHSGNTARDTAQNQQAYADTSSSVGSEARSRPLPVETALTAASAALEGVTDRTSPRSQRQPQEQEQQQQQQERQQAGHVRAAAHELHVSGQQDSPSAAGASNETAAAAAAQAAERQPGGSSEEEEVEDEDDVELRTADGDLPVRWLDCKVRPACGDL